MLHTNELYKTALSNATITLTNIFIFFCVLLMFAFRAVIAFYSHLYRLRKKNLYCFYSNMVHFFVVSVMMYI